MNIRDRAKNLKRTIRYFLLKGLVAAMTRLPVSTFPKLQRLFLKVFPLVFKSEIERARRLLPQEFQAQREKIIKGMTINQIATLLEVFFYDKLKTQIPHFVKIEGKRHLDRAIEEHGCFIILSAHFGNWEIIGYELARMGYPLHVVARPQAVNQMTQFINSFREKRGAKVIMGNNIIESLKLIKKKKVVGIVSDLNAREWGYQVDFFGRRASFYNAPVILADRGKVPLIPAFAERQKNGTQLIRFEEPVTWPENATMTEKIKAYVDRYEAAFRRRPDLWCWFHERYKHADLGRTE
jgi:KDO2-lipid IV(A) lauroyltransferase